MAKGDHLGEFEEVVLLALAACKGAPYGIEIYDAIKRVTGRDTSITAVYMTLTRLEQKGFVSSHKGEPTARRGGRAKRFYHLEEAGAEALRRNRRTFERLWHGARLHPLLEDT